MYQITSDSCLLIFDVHQNIGWVEAILEKEHGNFDHLILGGDYFDTTEKGLPGVKETAEWLLGMQERFGSRLTILLGNHDVQYCEVAGHVAQHRNARHRRYDIPSSFTNNKAKRICRTLTPDFWKQCRLFQVVNGWLISHAGVHPNHWPGALTPEESLEELELVCQKAIHLCGRMEFSILTAGKSRGGEQKAGGITWLDWEEEFVDEIPYPQIVGHTRGHGPRNIGRSWCLDGSQSC